MSKNKSGKFITGAIIGAGLGILFAPRKGSETRECLKEKTKELVDQLKNVNPKEIKEKLGQKLKEIKTDLENLNKETAVEMVKEKSSALMKKCDELITLAKEKSAPMIEQAASEVRKKTVSLLKNAADKLEEKKEDTVTSGESSVTIPKKKKTQTRNTKKKTA